jgi:hypothetical protein
MSKSFKKLGSLNIKKQARRFMKVKHTLPIQLGALAVVHFKRNLRQEGFVDDKLVRWEEVQRRKRGHKNYNPKQQQKMLVGKGGTGFNRTIRVSSASFRRVVIASRGKKYARYHNRGEGNLPKRQFMGESKTLRRKVNRRIKIAVGGVFK